MGTRHLIAVQIDEYKIAQYGQWNGYPSGQGVDVLAFITALMDDQAALETFKQKLRGLTWITPEELDAAWVAAGAAPGAEYVGMDIAEKFGSTTPHLSRNRGARVLGDVLTSAEPLKLQNSIDFAMDSLFCEWAYVIDFDSNTFEVFKGFNKQPTNGRFAGQVQVGRDGPGSNGYGPVALRHSWPLDQLPSEEEFLNELEPQEENKEEAE